MKALTVKNPWALLIAHGIKDIENRTWRTKYRGRIYIHAGQSLACKPSELKDLLTPGQYENVNTQKPYKPIIELGFCKSCIIGEVDIVGCVIGHNSIWAEHADMGAKPIWNWVLANPVLYEKPIENVKGALSFWEYKP